MEILVNAIEGCLKSYERSIEKLNKIELKFTLILSAIL